MKKYFIIMCALMLILNNTIVFGDNETSVLEGEPTSHTYYNKDSSNFEESSFQTSTVLSTPVNNDEAASKTGEILRYADSDNCLNGVAQSLVKGDIFKDLSSLLPGINSHRLKDEEGRSLNIDIGDNVYTTMTTWKGSSTQDVIYIEMRVKVVRDNEITFNDVFYWSF